MNVILEITISKTNIGGGPQPTDPRGCLALMVACICKLCCFFILLMVESQVLRVESEFVHIVHVQQCTFAR